MKVVHVVPVSPQKCGMYETTREQVVAENAVGIESYLFDPRPTKDELLKQLIGVVTAGAKLQGDPPAFRVDDGFEDREAKTVSRDFATSEADLIVSHSGVQGLEQNTTVPIIHTMHGRPRSSFLIEHRGESAICSQYHRWDKNPRFRAFIAWWPEFRQYWEMLIDPEKIHCFDSFVDLERWQPGKPGEFQNPGKINVVVADMWRYDKDPYFVMHAFSRFHARHPDAKLHIFGCQMNMDMKNKTVQMPNGWAVIFQCMTDKGMMGDVIPHVTSGLDNIYRAADMLITPHNMATRTVREPLACGCQVVAGLGNRFTQYTADPEDLEAFADAMDRALVDVREDKDGTVKQNRGIAEKNFDAVETMKKVKELYENVLSEAYKPPELAVPLGK